jgi:DNA invertase Pin-like site-specific DNA recombinase
MSPPRKPRAGIYARQSHGNVKSITEQIDACRADAGAQGARVVEVYEDTTSASRYARKARPDHVRLLADIAAGKLDVVVLWEPSRGDRDLTSWSGFLDACRKAGVKIRVTDHGRTYDVSQAREWRTLAEDGVDSGYESEKTRQRILRHHDATARAGRPSGITPYGYTRTYHPTTRELVAQEPHPERAAIVREVIGAIAEGLTIAEVTADLNARRVPPPSTHNRPRGVGKRWYASRVREMVRNVAYVGLRGHNGDRHEAIWPGIVDPETFWAARAILETRAGQGWRSARAEHLLTSVVDCGVCGSPLAGRTNPQLRCGRSYNCRARGCVGVPGDELEDLVLAYTLGRLARPDVYDSLRRAGEGGDLEREAARGEAARLRAELEDWRASAWDGRGTTPATLAAVEAGLAGRIAAAQARAERAGIPPAVRRLAGAGDELPERWAAMPMAAQRDVIGYLVRVTVNPGPRKHVRSPVAERVVIEWKGTP